MRAYAWDHLWAEKMERAPRDALIVLSWRGVVKRRDRAGSDQSVSSQYISGDSHVKRRRSRRAAMYFGSGGLGSGGEMTTVVGCGAAGNCQTSGDVRKASTSNVSGRMTGAGGGGGGSGCGSWARGHWSGSLISIVGPGRGCWGSSARGHESGRFDLNFRFRSRRGFSTGTGSAFGGRG